MSHPLRLILVPTAVERHTLEPLLSPLCKAGCEVELCGFGPVAAAARTAHLLAERRPSRVLLLGIAGSLDDRLAVGTACRFAEVACFGIGAGSGRDFMRAGDLGWHQWPGDPRSGSPPIGDRLPCTVSAMMEPPRAALLLTSCAASACADDVRTRKAMFPEAMAEDMEGFAVALACQLRGVPCDIIRGISNVAGDRDKSHWQVEAALMAAAALACGAVEV